MNCNSSTVDNGHNLDDDGSCSLSAATSQSHVSNAGLASTLSGGPPQVLTLLSTSPARDAGGQCTAIVTTDELGTTRPQGPACDIGAYEIPETTSTTALSSSPSGSAAYGQTVTFTATVSGASPTGTVTFFDGATALGTGTLNGSSVATFSTATLALGAHTLTAHYGADTNNSASTSASLGLTVVQATAMVSLSSSLNPSVVGQSVTFTATVSGGSPTGTVAFSDGGTTLATVAVSSGQASFATSSLTVGSHTITAQYSGDANNTSASTTLMQVVNAVPTATPTVIPPTLTPTLTPTPVVPASTPVPPTSTPVPPSGGGGGGGSGATPQVPPAPAVVAIVTPTAPAVVPASSNGNCSQVVVAAALAPGSVGPVIPVTVSLTLTPCLPAGEHLVLLETPAPSGLNAAQQGSLGGGDVTPVGSPITLTLALEDASGNMLPLPSDLLAQMVILEVPVLSPGVFAWLEELDAQGQFAGYVRPDATFDPSQNALQIVLPVSSLQGALFLPAVLQPSWVQNFDPNVHIWSGPTSDAIDFGVAGPQGTVYQVVGPQVLGRIYVFDPVTQGYGWIDASGVGPFGPPTS